MQNRVFLIIADPQYRPCAGVVLSVLAFLFNKAGDLVCQGTETEYKILDNIADQLGGIPPSEGP
ncbi:hypothetical protein EMIT043CA1_10542 [Pseudomonas brassicacearum]